MGKILNVIDLLISRTIEIILVIFLLIFNTFFLILIPFGISLPFGWSSPCFHSHYSGFPFSVINGTSITMTAGSIRESFNFIALVLNIVFLILVAYILFIFLEKKMVNSKNTSFIFQIKNKTSRRFVLILLSLVILVIIIVGVYFCSRPQIPEEEVENFGIEVLVPEEKTISEEIVSFSDCLTKGGDLAIKPGLVYESYPRQCNSPDGRIFIEGLEEYTIGKKINWREYKVPNDINEKIKAFNCPDWMQNIEWDKSYQDKSTLKFYFDNLLDQETQIAYLSKKTGAIAFIKENIIEENIFRYKGFNKINFIYPDHKIVSLYTNNINIYWQKINEDIRFSPNGQYLSFSLHIYDSRRTSIIDVNTGRDILLGYGVSCQTDDIVWSDNGNYVAINNSIDFMNGEGFEGILLGDMAENVRLNKIFNLEHEEVFQEKKRINKLGFDKSNEEIYFSVGKLDKDEFVLEVKYKYNISNKELIVIE
jgi:hypothetical protein